MLQTASWHASTNKSRLFSHIMIKHRCLQVGVPGAAVARCCALPPHDSCQWAQGLGMVAVALLYPWIKPSISNLVVRLNIAAQDAECVYLKTVRLCS